MSIRETLSPQSTWQRSMNMIMVLWCIFQQCLGTFTMLLVEGSSKTRFFRHLSNHVLRVRNFGNTKAVRLIVFFKMFKINLDFKNAAKNWEKIFCFWDNCIWIGIVKLSLLRTGYFSSPANVLTSSTKILHFNKRDFFQFHRLASGNWIQSRFCDADFNSAWVCLWYCLWKGPLKQHFLEIYLTSLSEFVTSKIENL